MDISMGDIAYSQGASNEARLDEIVKAIREIELKIIDLQDWTETATDAINKMADRLGMEDE